jgi:hypothetical protein
MLQLIVSEISQTLGSSLQPGQTSKVFRQNNSQGELRGSCKVSVTLIGGIEYITGIEVGAGDPYPAAGLNMQRLLRMLQRLPRLRSFVCTRCCSASLPPASQSIRLPPTLPNIAPNLVTLGLTASGLVGTLPSSYSNFTQMQEMFMADNFPTGQLPPEFCFLSELKVLLLSENRFVSEYHVVRLCYFLSQPGRGLSSSSRVFVMGYG